jgi:DNA-binding FrmR family transcriptional regulator
MEKEEKQLTFWDAVTNAKLEYLRRATGSQRKTRRPAGEARPRKPKGKSMIARFDELEKMGGVEAVKKMLESAEKLAQLEGGEEIEAVKRMIESAEKLSQLGGPDGARDVIKAREKHLERVHAAWAKLRNALAEWEEKERTENAPP